MSAGNVFFAMLIAATVIAVLGVALITTFRSNRRDTGDQLVKLEARLGDLADSVARLSDRVHQTQTESARTSADFSERLGDRHEALKREVREDLSRGQNTTQTTLHEFETRFTEVLHQLRLGLEHRHAETLQSQDLSLNAGLDSVRKALSLTLSQHLQQHSDALGSQMKTLTSMTDQRLQEIGGKVDSRLSEGFEKTNATFADIVKRLAMIDQAQQKITELSSNVVSLQSILADKKSRGAFGEVQLEGLVRNVLPEASFAMQHRLSNDRVVDCMVFLPEPTGHVAIDAKFPLESYAAMIEVDASEFTRKQAERQFKQDIKKHISDISDRYIVAGETAEGAMMFIPAEAVFAEIQARHRDLVDEAHRRRVWLVSPTTLWAVLNTSRAVLKDAATREQVHLIQEHLRELSKDFGRFRERMDKLATHIAQANEDARQVGISARKIGDRFSRIEDVELERLPLDGGTSDPGQATAGLVGRDGPPGEDA